MLRFQMYLFQLMNKLVLSLREQVRVYDEISMCMTRLRLPYPGEKRDKDSINVILPHEVSGIFFILIFFYHVSFYFIIFEQSSTNFSCLL